MSYAHGDDPTWIEAFDAALRQGLQDRLGQAPSTWQDSGHLRLGQNWQAEIEEAIAQTAAFLAIVSPGYLKSVWCQKERRQFLERPTT
ncbi:MAG: toll/interleukin-1 receptor domain-containing protein, partial [Vicinamibacterales bacterium]